MAEATVPIEHVAGCGEILLDACATGRRLTRAELESRRTQGARAAEAGLALRALIRDHLAAALEIHPRGTSGRSTRRCVRRREHAGEFR